VVIIECDTELLHPVFIDRIGAGEVKLQFGEIVRGEVIGHGVKFVHAVFSVEKLSCVLMSFKNDNGTTDLRLESYCVIPRAEGGGWVLFSLVRSLAAGNAWPWAVHRVIIIFGRGLLDYLDAVPMEGGVKKAGIRSECLA